MVPHRQLAKETGTAMGTGWETRRETETGREKVMEAVMEACGRQAAVEADSGEATRATGRRPEWPSRY